MKWYNIRRVLPIMLQSFAELIRHWFFVRNFSKSYLAPYYENDGSLARKDFRKIQTYCLMIPYLCGDSYGFLRGYGMTKQERTTLTHLACLSAIYDEFFDRNLLPRTAIEALTRFPKQFVPQNDQQRLYHQSYLAAIEGIQDKDLFHFYFYKVYEAQIASDTQITKEQLSFSELLQITRDKGGYSACLARTAFENKPFELEYEALYRYGGFMQIIEDMFDVYEDLQEGIKTIPNTSTDMTAFSELYHQEMQEVVALFHQLPYETQHVRNFLVKLVFFAARGYVCWYQFNELQKQSNGIFQPSTYTRSQLICDMEKVKNLLRNWWYCGLFPIDKK